MLNSNADCLLVGEKEPEDSSSGALQQSPLSSPPEPIDLSALARQLMGQGWACRLSDRELWVGKLGISEAGEILTDGRVGGVRISQLGAGVVAFEALLQKVAARSSTASRVGNHAQLRPPPRQARHQRQKAKDAMNRFLELVGDCKVHVLRLSTARFLIAPSVGRVSFNTHSGRIFIKGRKAPRVRGLVALVRILAQEARDLRVGDRYPPLLRKIDMVHPIIVEALKDSLERRWAGELAVQALAFA